MHLLQFGEARTQLGSGLLHYGLAPHMTVGIYSVNCTGWVLVAEAANAYSMVPVPLYDTLGPDAVRYISGHAELSAIACSANLLSVLLPCLAECPTIQLVVRPPCFFGRCSVKTAPACREGRVKSEAGGDRCTSSSSMLVSTARTDQL